MKTITPKDYAVLKEGYNTALWWKDAEGRYCCIMHYLENEPKSRMYIADDLRETTETLKHLIEELEWLVIDCSGEFSYLNNIGEVVIE